MHLSVRLQKILQLIPEGTRVLADIGCDHGKLIVSAVSEGKAEKGIGVDISENSLQKAVALAEEINLSDKIRFIEGDGLSHLQDVDIDVCVIAGLGGNEIVKILSCDNKVKRFILCPHQDAHVVRAFMNDNFLTAIKDFIVKDADKFYPIIVAQKGNKTYSSYELYLGKNDPNTDDFVKKNEKRLLYLQNIVQHAEEYSRLTEEIKKEYEILVQWQKLRK